MSIQYSSRNVDTILLNKKDVFTKSGFLNNHLLNKNNLFFITYIC